MSGNFPKSRHRSKPDDAAPFDLVLDRLGKQQGAPSDAAPGHSRVMPPGDWPYPAADVAPVSPAAATAQMYDLDIAGATLKVTPRSIEEAVTEELQLSDDLAPADLERIRRTFAYRNHPDRVGPAHKLHALRRMTAANVLIDQALETARARAR